MRKLIIAIDGPSGAGKSTLGKALARALGYQYIDSGAVYRAIGSAAINNGLPLDDAMALSELARQSAISLEGDPDHLRVVFNGADVTLAIRKPEASRAASVVATIPAVRDAVVLKLREMSRDGGVVMDGRDIGTKVFPDAQVKLFLDASPDTRARRRWEEEKLQGRDATIEQIKSEINERDLRDRERLATPLVKAKDALPLDTTDKSLEQVVETALEIVRSRS
jgi:cytidylate kinase